MCRVTARFTAAIRCAPLRTAEFHYIRNFKSDRWPGGDPNGLDKPGTQPYTYEQLARNTNVALADIDSGPTKAYLTLHREDPAVRPLYELAAGKRPQRELFDLAKDPFQMRNVAADPKYAGVVKRLDARLIAELRATGDPRVEGHGDVSNSYPARVPPGS